MIGRELSCSSPSAAVDPDERVAPKRDMVALGLDELAAAAAGGVVGIPAPAGVRIDVEDGGVPLVGVVVMFDFYLGESKNPNHVEEEAAVSFTGTGYEKLRNEGAAGWGGVIRGWARARVFGPDSNVLEIFGGIV